MTYHLVNPNYRRPAPVESRVFDRLNPPNDGPKRAEAALQKFLDDNAARPYDGSR